MKVRTSRACLSFVGAAVSVALVGCGGSGSSSPASSPSQSPSTSVTATPSAQTLQTIPEHLTATQAAWVKPRLVGHPGVADVRYQSGKELFWVYLVPGATKKQRADILHQLALATTK